MCHFRRAKSSQRDMTTKHFFSGMAAYTGTNALGIDIEIEDSTSFNDSYCDDNTGQ